MATKIGEMLLKGSLITQEQLLTALDTQKRTRERIGSGLGEAGAIKEPELLSFLGRQFNIPVVELSKYEINPEVVRLLPEDMVQKNLALPINRVGAKLIVAVADPSNMAILDAIGFKTGYSVELVLASEREITPPSTSTSTSPSSSRTSSRNWTTNWRSSGRKKSTSPRSSAGWTTPPSSNSSTSS